MARRLSRWHTAPLLSLLVWCGGISPGIAGDRPDFTYRTNASEVRLSFSATGQNNHGVATLQASDSAIVDTDVIVRNFQSFTRSDWTKLEIAILIDASESATPRFRQEMADVLDLVSHTEGVPDENLSIFSFAASQPAMLCAGNHLAHALERAPAACARGLTPLYDTIVFAADYLSSHGDMHAEKVLIVFSDGMDTISRNALGDAVNAALRSKAELDCIDLNKPAYRSQGAAALRSLAGTTGGRYFPAPGGAAQALNAILEGFRANYSISYRLPSHASGFHTVRILSTHNLNLQFRSRSGYYYPNRAW